MSTSFGSGKVQEWFEYGGEPNHYRIFDVDIRQVNDNIRTFLQILEVVSRKSAVLDSIRAISVRELILYFGAVMSVTKKFKLTTGEANTDIDIMGDEAGNALCDWDGGLIMMDKGGNGMTHWLTPDGYNVMLRGLMGDAIKFTRIKYGNGTPGDGANDLKNPLLSLKIASATRSEKYVTLSVSFKNVELEITGFWATEIGIYVEDPDDSTKELCYCIWEETEVEKADYINPNVERLLASQYDFVVFVSEAENVSAALGETLVYATVSELNNHKNDHNNPHKVTKGADRPRQCGEQSPDRSDADLCRGKRAVRHCLR